MKRTLFLIALAFASPLFAMNPPTPEELAALPVAPDALAGKLLAQGSHPMLLTPEAVLRARQYVLEEDWAKAYLQAQEAICARFVGMEEADLRALIPPAASIYVMGLGMNLDPVDHLPLVWCGWDDPHAVRDSKGTRYPNEEWPDEGIGILQPGSSKRYYFRAIANYRIMRAIEEEVLPALADVYTLTGSEVHARTAAILLDAIATVYPSSFRGPLDYPMGKALRPYGGRMNRPTQQVARGLANYAQVVDLIAVSGELEKPSGDAPEETRAERIAKRILWNGASYCLLFGRQVSNLSNGMADFNYGAAAAGMLLREPAFYHGLIGGEKSIYTMLDNNLIRQDFYFETSPAYEVFTLDLYLKSAELIEALRREKLTDRPSLYEHRGAAQWMTALFQRREVGGHIPLMGNTRVDSETITGDAALPEGSTQGRFMQMARVSTQLIALRSEVPKFRERAVEALHRFGGGRPLTPEPTRFDVFYYQPLPKVEAEAGASVLSSSFEGGKGLAMLRARKPLAYGAQLFFGPAQVKSQNEALSWTFFHNGSEWSYDPGRFNAHFRFGWCASSVAHQSLVVNRKDVSQQTGGGYLRSFRAGGAVEWAFASHPDAYREEGVSRYERWIAQVSSEDGGLLYWLDIGAVSGGELREESFHSQMKEVAFLPAQNWTPEGDSLFGKENLGRLIDREYRLQGRKEGFYWTPPGSGFGFLGRPRRATHSGPLRTEWTNPAFSPDRAAKLVVDYAPAAPGVQRSYLLSDGPEAHQHPSVPYLLRSDKGGASSRFAKILHFVSGAPRLRGIETIAMEGEQEREAWLVTHENGVRDLWFLNHEAGKPALLALGEEARIETDALLLFARLSAEGSIQRVDAEAASFIRWNGEEIARQKDGFAEGVVTAIEENDLGMVLKVRWNRAMPAKRELKGGIVVQVPGKGAKATWELEADGESQIVIADTSDLLGGGAARQEGDWIVFPHELSRLVVARGSNRDLAAGKPVYANGKLIGRVAEVRDDARAIRLDQAIQLRPENLRIEIREWAVGDHFSIPLPLSTLPPEP